LHVDLTTAEQATVELLEPVPLVPCGLWKETSCSILQPLENSRFSKTKIDGDWDVEPSLDTGTPKET
jgi:hypothetical protein